MSTERSLSERPLLCRLGFHGFRGWRRATGWYVNNLPLWERECSRCPERREKALREGWRP